jgi:hypothetical protein
VLDLGVNSLGAADRFGSSVFRKLTRWRKVKFFEVRPVECGFRRRHVLRASTPTVSGPEVASKNSKSVGHRLTVLGKV